MDAQTVEQKRARVAWATQHPRLPEYMSIAGPVVDVKKFERWLEDIGEENNCPYPSQRTT